MDDLISRQDALTEIRKDGKWLEEQGVTSMTTHERELRDTFILREIPSAQKKGHWLPIIDVNEYGEPYQSGVYCSECGHRDIAEYDFCPNCGTDMRGTTNG